MQSSQRFDRDYVRLLILLALPLVGVLFAKVAFGALPTGNYYPGKIAFNGERLLLWAHVSTDALTGLSYIWIAIVLSWLVYRVRDTLPYHTVMLAFSAFIISCGANHLAHVWTMFWPNYWIEATVKGVMAVASLATAFAILPIVPAVVGLVRTAQLSEHRKAEIRSRDEFLRVAAHEFKTPITAISGYTQLLLGRAAHALEPRDKRAIAVINEQCVRLTSLVENLLDLSRLETERFSINRKPLSLTSLTSRLVDETSTIVNRHTITMENLAPELCVAGDEQRLTQVLENLIGNAIKYSPEGGPITVTLMAVEGEARLSVSDRGIGIPRNALPHLFDRFFRADNVDRHGVLPGFGVGLYVVKEIVELHGGKITVSTVEDEGTTFTISLPLLETGVGSQRPRPTSSTAT